METDGGRAEGADLWDLESVLAAVQPRAISGSTAPAHLDHCPHMHGADVWRHVMEEEVGVEHAQRAVPRLHRRQQAAGVGRAQGLGGWVGWPERMAGDDAWEAAAGHPAGTPR